MIVAMVHPEIVDDFTKFLFIYGSRGSAKSTSVAMKVIINCLMFPRVKFIVARKTHAAVMSTIFPIYLDLLDKYNIPYVLKKSESTIVLPNNSQIMFVGMYTNGYKNEKLKSLTIGGIAIEEATEIEEQDLLDLMPALRQQEGKRQIILCFNPPPSSSHWIYKFYEQRKKDAKKIHFSYVDNPFIPADFVKELESLKEYNKGLFRRYTKGEWGVDTIEGKIYNEYEVQHIDLHRFNYGKFNIIAGVDFGYNNPSVVLIIAIDTKNKIIYVLDELYEVHKVDDDFAKDTVQFLADKGLVDLIIYADPSSPQRIATMRQHNLCVYEADNDVKAGISVLQSYHITINDICTHTINEIQNYVWQKKGGNTIDAPVKFNDHAMDAMRYAVYTFVKNGTMEAYIL